MGSSPASTWQMLEIIMNPEVVLSIAVLSLVFYGVYWPTLKLSVGVLFIVGVITVFGAWGGDWPGSSGLLMDNSWIIMLKVIIIIGSISILLMSGSVASGLILMVVLSSLLLVSSVN